ncbi:MAG: hypothetical protein GX816_03350 [Erysipelotrichia bacterium]|jgi:hypothetical protein|nr:hypothetical protein [Erysipelotrichia bacterium]
MQILKAIGAFFVRIGRWIKDTAWVQPLLIVGAIFAVIFSIPSITSWIEGLAEEARSSEKYYQKFQRSLAGGETSEADKLIADIQDGDAKNSVGEKFFLVFVSEECSACAEAKNGFEALERRWNGTLAPKSDDLPFKLVSIFTDEDTDEATSRETAFVQFLNRNGDFFTEAAQIGKDSYYHLNGNSSESDLDTLEAVDTENFLTPTIMLIDFSEDYEGVSEVMFGVPGDTDIQKAELLRDCWDHSGDFEGQE